MSLQTNFLTLEAAAGTQFVHHTRSGFAIPTSKMTVLVDMFGYDGSVALSALEESPSNFVNLLRSV